MSLSDYVEAALLNWVRGTTMPAAPTTVYLSLHTADPGETGLSEHGATAGYQRQAIALSAPPSPLTNTNVIEFPQATTDYSAPVTHAALWTAQIGGNLIVTGPLAAARTYRAGDIPRFPAGSVSFTLD